MPDDGPAPDAIDAVVTWVDGDDPRHREKLNRYQPPPARRTPDAAPTRFRSRGEIDYCVASLLKFAPFIRRIHVVTDEQVPPVLARAEGSLRHKLVRVDHRDIFAGHEDCLPTFNSISIETLLYRTPGLAEQFVYLNDDFFLIRTLQPTDFFRGGWPVLRGRYQAPPQRRIDRRLKRLVQRWFGTREGAQRTGFLDVQAHGAALAGYTDRFLTFEHVPQAMRRSTFESFFAAHPDRLRSNIRHRLRDRSQFLPQSLANHLELRAGTAHLEADPRLAYLKPARLSGARLARKLDAAGNDASLRFACVQSLDQADPSAQEQVIAWLERIIGPAPREA